MCRKRRLFYSVPYYVIDMSDVVFFSMCVIDLILILSCRALALV